MEPEEKVHGTTPLALKRQWRVMKPEEKVHGTTPLAQKYIVLVRAKITLKKYNINKI
jgi:hypothetical protein